MYNFQIIDSADNLNKKVINICNNNIYSRIIANVNVPSIVLQYFINYNFDNFLFPFLPFYCLWTI